MTCWNELSLEFTSFHLFSSFSSFIIPFFSLHQLYLRTNWNSVDQNPDGIVFEEKYALLRWIVSVSYNRNLFFSSWRSFFQIFEFFDEKIFSLCYFLHKTVPYRMGYLSRCCCIVLLSLFGVKQPVGLGIYKRQIIQRIVNLQIIVIFLNTKSIGRLT